VTDEASSAPDADNRRKVPGISKWADRGPGLDMSVRRRSRGGRGLGPIGGLGGGAVPGTTPLWDSKTGKNPGARLEVQDDGNVVIYDGSRPLWSTKTGS
jgi:hypothetical protein